jgi:thiol-disulfide isomerase/thioredoxin
MGARFILPVALLVAFLPLSHNALDGAEPANGKASVSADVHYAKKPVAIEGTFGKGWKQTVSYPIAASASDQVTLWTQDGWLAARRTSATGALDWQVFLCPFEDGKPPEIFLRDGLEYVEVSYGDGRYFIRDSDFVFRCRRMPKMQGELFAKKETLSANAAPRGTAGSVATGLHLSSWNEGEWFCIAAGPSDDQWHSFVRLDPEASRGNGYGVQVIATGLTYFFHGEHWLIDDGELIVATRTLEANYRQEQKVQAARKALTKSGKLPPIDATKWLNSEPLSWDQLKGKVVLIDFWGTWCGPCVAKLPTTQALHEKFAKDGLVVIAVHSSQDADSCPEFIEKNKYKFPVALDSGKTAEAFAIDSWPTYFLLDRSGKLVQSFTSAPPKEEAIAKLLKREAK